MKESYLLDSKPMVDIVPDKDVTPGETYSYEALPLATGETASEVTVTIPEDLVIKAKSDCRS